MAREMIDLEKAASSRKHAQKQIHMIRQVPRMPQPFKMKDWRETALKYDALVFDYNSKGEHMPLIWRDRSNKLPDEDTFGIMSYVGKYEQGEDGTQESLNVMGAVLGATLVGIDKSNQDGHNYVRKLQSLLHKDEKVFVSKPIEGSGNTFWYELQPHVLFYALAWYYPEVEGMEDMMRMTADRWVEAVEVLKGEDPLPDFKITAFNFEAMEAVDNGKWREPDAAAGIAMMMLMAHSRFGDAKYLQTAETCMEFLDRQQQNPFYEILLYYAPHIAARMNVEHGKRYNIDKFMNWVFDGGNTRPGWGAIMDHWGGYDVHGLIGSRWDDGGYAFAMNGFALFGALAPVVRYDPRFARDIARWMLNAANQSRLFYADELPPENQSGYEWDGDPEHVIPYEGLRKEYDGKNPYASGDPTVMGWGERDFSLYSGSYSGFLGGLLETTNVEGILKIDCLKTDYYHSAAYPTYLYYNPHESARKIRTTDLGEGSHDLYDTVSGQYLARGVRDGCSFVLEPDQAAVVIVVPPGSKMTWKDGHLWMGNVFVAPKINPVVNVLHLQNGQTVSGVLEIPIDTFVPAGEHVTSFTVTFGGRVISKTAGLPKGSLRLDTTAFENKLLHLRVIAESSDGGQDQTEVGLLVEN